MMNKRVEELCDRIADVISQHIKRAPKTAGSDVLTALVHTVSVMLFCARSSDRQAAYEDFLMSLQQRMKEAADEFEEDRFH